MEKTIIEIVKFAAGFVAFLTFWHFAGKIDDFIEEKWHKKDGKGPIYHSMVAIGILGIAMVILVAYTTHLLRTGQVPTEMVLQTKELTKAFVGMYTCVALFVCLTYFLFSNSEKEGKGKKK